MHAQPACYGLRSPHCEKSVRRRRIVFYWNEMHRTSGASPADARFRNAQNFANWHMCARHQKQTLAPYHGIEKKNGERDPPPPLCQKSFYAMRAFGRIEFIVEPFGNCTVLGNKITMNHRTHQIIIIGGLHFLAAKKWVKSWVTLILFVSYKSRHNVPEMIIVTIRMDMR